MEVLLAIFIFFVGLIGLILLFSMIRIVREYERLVVFRLGRCIGTNDSLE
jgi:SPFH domain, Band 7 family protein